MAADIPFVQHVFDTADAEASALELAPFLFRTGQPSEGQIRVKTLTEGTTNAVRTKCCRSNASLTMPYSYSKCPMRKLALNRSLRMS